MNTSSMRLFLVLIRSIRKLSFWKRTPHLPLTPLWILQGQMKSQEIKSRGLQPIILRELMLLSVARLLLMQQIHPANPVAPSFVYVDAVVDISQRTLSPAFGSICSACGKENHWRKVSRSSKPNRKKKNARGGSKHSKSSKEKRGPEKHLHTLETHDEAEVDNAAYLPEQLYFHTLLIDQVTKMILKPSWSWKSRLISVRNHLCARSTLVLRETSFL